VVRSWLGSWVELMHRLALDNVLAVLKDTRRWFFSFHG
jgi:hypothetical protein